MAKLISFTLSGRCIICSMKKSLPPMGLINQCWFLLIFCSPKCWINKLMKFLNINWHCWIFLMTNEKSLRIVHLWFLLWLLIHAAAVSALILSVRHICLFKINTCFLNRYITYIISSFYSCFYFNFFFQCFFNKCNNLNCKF